MLLIYANGAYWYVEIENTNIFYRFAGADFGARLDNVQAFAEALQSGNAGVAPFLNVPPEMPPAELTEQLFQDTNGIAYGLDAEEGMVFQNTLIDNLEEVGDFLLTCLGV